MPQLKFAENKEEVLPNGLMRITRKSAVSRQINTMDLPVTQEQYDKWDKGGELIQNAMPNLTNAQREFLLSGITPEEWDTSFKDQE